MLFMDDGTNDADDDDDDDDDDGLTVIKQKQRVYYLDSPIQLHILSGNNYL